MRDEFKSFLESYNGNLHRPTTYKLMASQGRNEEFLFFASLIGDYDKVISHWITEKNWSKALAVLSKEVNQKRNNVDTLTQFFNRLIQMYFTSSRQY